MTADPGLDSVAQLELELELEQLETFAGAWLIVEDSCRAGRETVDESAIGSAEPWKTVPGRPVHYWSPC